MSIPCYICESLQFKEVLNASPSMTSDVQTIDIKIIKEECQKCGTVRSSDVSFLDDFYNNYYKLNKDNIDPLYIYEGEAIEKSKMHFEWISQLMGDKYVGLNSIIEIGCGSGNLLKLFEFENKFGVEPSLESSQHAGKSANVRSIGFEEINDNEKYDLVLSTCVIEHTIDPNEFLQKNRNIVSEDGIVIVGLPIQDTESFDVYFLDHLHHFSSSQFMHLAKTNGFEVLNYEIGYKCMTTLGYFVLQKCEITKPEVSFDKNSNFFKTEDLFNNLNSFLESQPGIKIVAFGYGETSFFYQTYTRVKSFVDIYVDDVKAGESSIVISAADAINNNVLENTVLILLVNPHYNKFIMDKFKSVENLKFYSPFSNSYL